MTSTGSSSVAGDELGDGRVVAAVLIRLIIVIAVAESDAAPEGIRDA